MDVLRRHEIFEINVLEGMKDAHLLEGLVFGGGTMLRLCYGLNRYSVGLDFWFIKNIKPTEYFTKMQNYLKARYDVTDAHAKFYTLLFEIRSKDYPKRLKIEMRKEARESDFQDRIAFSPFSTKQVILRVHTLEQTMKNKIAAAIDRKEIRDFFDIEFLLRQGIPIAGDDSVKRALVKIINGFKDNDYKVTLGATLDAEIRRYYSKNKFSYLLSNLQKRGYE